MVKLFFAILLAIIYPSIAFSQAGSPIRYGQSCAGAGGDLGGTFPACTVLGVSLNEQLGVTNLGIEFTESDSNPPCAAGNYNIYADLSEQKIKMCTNGVQSILGASGGASTTLQQAFDAGDGTITGMQCGTKPLRLGQATSYTEICFDGADMVHTSKVSGADSNSVRKIPTGKLGQDYCGTDLCEQVTSAGVHSYHGPRRPWVWRELGARDLIGDGTQCNAGTTNTTINGWPVPGIHCSMPGSTVNGWIGNFSKPITLPANFDNTGTIMARGSAHIVSDLGVGTFHGTLIIDCVAQGEKVGDSWGTQINLDFTPIDADLVGELVTDSAASAFDATSGGVDCNPGDKLYFMWTACDTGSTTGGCSSSAGFEVSLDISGFEIGWREKGDSE